MSKRDYYDVLGVSRDADEKELKGAFRRLAKQYHPDRNPDDAGAEQRFKEVNEAYEALKDPEKRAAYDRFGHAAFEGGMGGGGHPHGFGADFSASMSEIFDDLFGEFMGGRRGRPRSGHERGGDLRYNMEISLSEAFTGKTAQIRVPSSVICDSCGCEKNIFCFIRSSASRKQHLLCQQRFAYRYLSLILITSLGSDNNKGLLHRSSYVTMDCMKLSEKRNHRKFKIEQDVLSF